VLGRDSEAAQKLMADCMAGRVSRRQLVKRAAALGLSVPAFASLLSVNSAFAQATPSASPVIPVDDTITGDVEIFSWWTSGGEAAALQTLFDNLMLVAPNVNIVNATVAGGAGVNAQAVLQTRLASNDPPDSWQTHIGHELYDRYVTPGYCDPITDLYDSQGWNTVIPQGLIDQVTQDGEKYAIPVGVHRGNGLWYNKQVLADAGVEVGDTLSLDEFFTAADMIKAKGNATAWGMGDKEGFPDTQNFENTLLAVLGPDNYIKLFTGDLAWDDPSVKEAADTYGRILGYLNTDHSALAWADATADLIDGKFGFNAMGDWAYGEFVKKGVTDKIGWVSAPGTAGSFVLVVDCFTLPKGAPNAAAATAWLKVLGTVGAQAAFNPLKGSIPARTDVPRTGFSEYHQWSMDSFAADNLVPSIAHGEAVPPAVQSAIADATLSFVSDLDSDTLLAALVSAAQS
jgi:glucose/mannose transport system substrate-binding protein